MNAIISRIMQRLGHRQADPVPPKKLVRWVGPGDFETLGQEFLRHFIDLAGLEPHEKVLDVGCGCGRLALPLTKYLSSEGTYEGFDVIPQLIKWCSRNVTPRYPHFHFRMADIYNKVYNPRGKLKSHEYEFPYDGESFDFVFLTSVFTHMLPRDIEHYFSEITRVLKRGGTLFATYFLLNDESRRLISQGVSDLDFKYDFDGCLVLSTDAPERAIAYDEVDILGLHKKYTLEIADTLYYGSWCGRQRSLSYQDIVIANRAS